MSKRIDKPANKNVILKKGVEYQGEASGSMRAIANKNKKIYQKAKAKERDEDQIDSANVLQQLCKDMVDFHAKYIGTSCTKPSRVQGEIYVPITDKSNSCAEDGNFDTMAFELEEAMAGVSE